MKRFFQLQGPQQPNQRYPQYRGPPPPGSGTAGGQQQPGGAGGAGGGPPPRMPTHHIRPPLSHAGGAPHYFGQGAPGGGPAATAVPGQHNVYTFQMPQGQQPIMMIHNGAVVSNFFPYELMPIFNDGVWFDGITNLSEGHFYILKSFLFEGAFSFEFFTSWRIIVVKINQFLYFIFDLEVSGTSFELFALFLTIWRINGHKCCVCGYLHQFWVVSLFEGLFYWIMWVNFLSCYDITETSFAISSSLYFGLS